MEVQKLVVEVHRATAIQDVNMFTKQDPYVKAALLPEKNVTARTLEAYAGGTEPTWDCDVEMRVVDHHELWIECYDHDASLGVPLCRDAFTPSS